MSIKTMLRTYELFLLGQSANYDLSLKKERTRSVSELEKLFFRILNYVQPDAFVEAGAKDASTSERARSHLPNAKITAFEANPNTYKKFKSHPRMKKANINYINNALSDKIGKLDFSLQAEVDGVLQSKTKGDGSILKPTKSDIKLQAHSVDATTLDKFQITEGFSNAFIWIDVEGANKQVLLGSENALMQSTNAVFMEIEDRAYWESQWLSHDVHKFMVNNKFIPIARDFQSRYQYNVLYIHEKCYEIDYVKFAIQMHFSKTNMDKLKTLLPT